MPSPHEFAAEVLRTATRQLETTRQGRHLLAVLDQHGRAELGGLLACIANNAGMTIANLIEEAADDLDLSLSHG